MFYIKIHKNNYKTKVYFILHNNIIKYIFYNIINLHYYLFLLITLLQSCNKFIPNCLLNSIDTSRIKT